MEFLPINYIYDLVISYLPAYEHIVSVRKNTLYGPGLPLSDQPTTSNSFLFPASIICCFRFAVGVSSFLAA